MFHPHDDHPLDDPPALPRSRTRSASTPPGGGRRPTLGLTRPPLEISAVGPADAREHRAQLAFGRERYGDAARIARAFTGFVVSVTETSGAAEHSHVTTELSSAGNTVVVLRSPRAGIPAILIVGLLDPIIEAHVEGCLDRGRTLGPDADLTVCVDVAVTRPTDGGVMLRVVLYAGTRPLPPLGPADDVDNPPASSPEAVAPRRFASGFQVRDGTSLDLEEAIAFANERG